MFLGDSFYNSSISEAINSSVDKYTCKEGDFQNKVFGLTKIVKKYAQNQRAFELSDESTKMKPRRRIIKSLIITMAFNQMKNLNLYDENGMTNQHSLGRFVSF